MSNPGCINANKLKSLYDKCNAQDISTLHAGDGDDRFYFTVKHRIGIREASKIVDSVCDAVINPSTGVYRPELKDYRMRVEVLKAYTNIPLPPDDECWDLVYGTPIFAMITGRDKCPVIFDFHEYDDNRVIDVEQYEQIVAAIEQKIAHALNMKLVKEIDVRASLNMPRKSIR